MKNFDIVIFYGPPWDQAARLSKHHFARLWSSNNRVLYIEAPMNTFSFFTRTKEAFHLWKRYRNGVEKISENLWVSTYYYPLPYRGNKYLFGSKCINTINQYFIRKKIKSHLKQFNFNNPILFIGSAHALPIIDYFNPSKIIYHCSDDYTLVPSFPRTFFEIEKKLIQRSDLVITTADELKKAKQHLNKNTISIPNGVSIDHFEKAQDKNTKTKNDINQIHGPIIGYVGTIFSWINQDWIEYAANENKSYNFVFIGPITTNVSKLKRLKNIYFLGPKPYIEIPNYLKAFSVATIPFVIDGVTLKASPIKFYEYLAAGIPIVTTDLPDLNSFSEYVSLVTTKESFSSELNKIIKTDNEALKNRRMKLAKSFSWESRFNQLNESVNNLFL